MIYETNHKRTRYIPAGYQCIPAPEGANSIAYANGLAAIGYAGKAAKPSFHYIFRDESRRDQFIAQWYAGQVARFAEKTRRQQERKEYAHNLTVGSIIVNSWGYEQTNIDFYEVVKVPSSKSVVLRPIGSNLVEDGAQGMSGRVTPRPGKFTSEKTYTKRVSPGNFINFDCGSGSEWTGRPMYCSWYA